MTDVRRRRSVQRPSRPGARPRARRSSSPSTARCRARRRAAATTSATSAATSGHRRQRQLHPRHGLHRGVGDADRRQPDEAFTGGDAVKWGGMFTDRGKTGYHGYWGDNFYVLDEHWPSPLDFRGFTDCALHAQGLKVVLDIVCNHGSPAFSMPKDQPSSARSTTRTGSAGRRAEPAAGETRSRAQPAARVLQHRRQPRSCRTERKQSGGARLPRRRLPAVDRQGADAFRIDTIGWMPDAFWKRFVGRIRARSTRASSCSARISTTTRTRSRTTPTTRAARSACSTSRSRPVSPGVRFTQHAGSNACPRRCTWPAGRTRTLRPRHLTTTTTWRGWTPTTTASSTPTTGCSPRASRPYWFGNRFPNAATPSTWATATTSARTRGRRAGSPIYQSLKRIAHVPRQKRPRCSAGCRVVLELQGDRAAFLPRAAARRHRARSRWCCSTGRCAGAVSTSATCSRRASGARRSPARRRMSPRTAASPATCRRMACVWLLDGPVTREDLRAAGWAMAATRGAG